MPYVTPGGAGILQAVDLTQEVHLHWYRQRHSHLQRRHHYHCSAHNINPANPGTVLISGVSTKNTNFNGTFSGITVIDANNFAYSQTAVNDSVTGGTTAAPVGTVSYGNAFLQFTVSQTQQGIAINPITRSGRLGRSQFNGAQVTFLNTLDQSLVSISLLDQDVVLGGSTAGAAGEIGDTSVGYQPYSNTAVVFNPHLNQFSLLDPARLVRYRYRADQAATASVPSTFRAAVPRPTRFPIPGALAVDATNNVALAVNSGSNNISVVHLGTIKPVEISQVVASSQRSGRDSAASRAHDELNSDPGWRGERADFRHWLYIGLARTGSPGWNGAHHGDRRQQ